MLQEPTVQDLGFREPDCWEPETLNLINTGVYGTRLVSLHEFVSASALLMESARKDPVWCGGSLSN